MSCVWREVLTLGVSSVQPALRSAARTMEKKAVRILRLLLCGVADTERMPVLLLRVDHFSTVRMEDLAGHVRGVVRCEEDVRGGDFGRFAWAAKGNIRSELLDLL